MITQVNAITGAVSVTGQEAPPFPEAIPPIDTRRVQMVLTDIQFAIACVGAGLMTAQEAEDWVGSGALPVAAEAAILSLPEEFRAPARIRFRGARTIARLDPFIASIQATLELSDEAVDALFDAGAAI
jgi:hypothetical protein